MVEKRLQEPLTDAKHIKYFHHGLQKVFRQETTSLHDQGLEQIVDVARQLEEEETRKKYRRQRRHHRRDDLSDSDSDIGLESYSSSSLEESSSFSCDGKQSKKHKQKGKTSEPLPAATKEVVTM